MSVKRREPMRRGYWRDLKWVFQIAREMCGGLYGPDDIGNAQRMVKNIERETVRAVRGRR